MLSTPSPSSVGQTSFILAKKCVAPPSLFVAFGTREWVALARPLDFFTLASGASGEVSAVSFLRGLEGAIGRVPFVLSISSDFTISMNDENAYPHVPAADGKASSSAS